MAFSQASDEDRDSGTESDDEIEDPELPPAGESRLVWCSEREKRPPVVATHPPRIATFTIGL